MSLVAGTRGRVFAISAAVVAVLGVVAIVIAVTRPDAKSDQAAAGPGAQSAVRSFFAALSAGDARTALTYVAQIPGFDPATDPLLTDAALGPDRRPAAVQVGSARQVTGLTFVDVTYQARDTAVQQTVGVTREGGGYRLRDVLVGLAVTGVQGRPVSVNGVEMGTDDLNVGVFPGSYEVSIAENALFEGETLTVVPQVALGGVTAAANLGAPEMTANATAAVQREVRRALDKCATATGAKPPGCPFWLDIPGGGAANVKWSIKKYPAVTPKVTPLADGFTVSLSDDGRGVAHWTGTFVDKTGHSRFGSGDIPFDVAGSAKPVGTGVTVSLTT